MAGMYNDDESTDDEYGMNLAERLSINKGDSSNFVEDKKFESSKEFKQFCNMRRKKFSLEGQSSSSSSIEVPSENSSSLLACPDIYHNKKRQNGDKNIEQLANPKRTCLSDRFHRTPDWREYKKKSNRNHRDSEHPIFPESLCLQSRTSPNLLLDKKNKKQTNSIVDEDDSDFEIPNKINRRAKLDSSDNSKCNNRSSPTSSKKQVQNIETKASTSYLRKFFDSSSEDESKLVLQNGALKGGKQDSSVDQKYLSKNLFTRKLNKKLLDSDESEDDSTTAYRSKPLVFSSSDSEDFKKNSTKSELTATTSNNLVDHSCFYGDGFDKNISHHSRQRKSFRPNQKFSKKTYCSPTNRVDSAEGCDRQFLSTDFQRKNLPHRNCRFRRSPRMNMTSSLSPNVLTISNNISGPVRGRRGIVCERGGRRSGSPHPRSNRYQHEDESKYRGRSVSASRVQKEIPSYAAKYPDVFDAEESENEYFTANSYSDTEASTESLGGLTISSTYASHYPRKISCSLHCKDRLFEDASTDDEISVVFSSAPCGRNNESNRGATGAEDKFNIGFSTESFGRNNETSRGTSRTDEEISVIFSTGMNGRNNDSRRSASRTLGRRHNRGTHRQLQNARELVSLSPDPVEQVRQMEEDERMARMLQAQFDAEIDPDYTPINRSVLDHEDSDDDEDEEDDIIDPVGDSDSDESPSPVANAYPRFPHNNRRGFGTNRFTSRSDSPLSVYLNAAPRVDSRMRRRSHFPPPARQLARFHNLFGMGIDLFGEDDDYETLLSLDLDSEIYPRGLHSSDINRLPTRKFVHPNSSTACSSNSEVTHKRTGLNKECQVCLTDYENGDLLRILPCFHEFHTPCIDPWLLINHTCPVCRVTVDLDV